MGSVEVLDHLLEEGNVNGNALIHLPFVREQFILLRSFISVSHFCHCGQQKGTDSSQKNRLPGP